MGVNLKFAMFLCWPMCGLNLNLIDGHLILKFKCSRTEYVKIVHECIIIKVMFYYFLPNILSEIEMWCVRLNYSLNVWTECEELKR